IDALRLVLGDLGGLEASGLLQSLNHGPEQRNHAAGYYIHQSFPLPLKDSKQPGSQVAGNKQAKEGDGPIVFALDGVVNSEGEIAAGQNLQSGNPIRAVAISLNHNAMDDAQGD